MVSPESREFFWNYIFHYIATRNKNLKILIISVYSFRLYAIIKTTYFGAQVGILLPKSLFTHIVRIRDNIVIGDP